jgi:hypothetical protein
MRTNNCQSAEQQQSATTQRLPVKQRCVVKLHREDEGVVLRIQLVIDDESTNRTSCASLYHMMDENETTQGLIGEANHRHFCFERHATHNPCATYEIAS